jgi:hypothetical protein
MADPLTLAIATAAAGKAVELTGQPVKEGIVALGRMVRGRFSGQPADAEILNGAVADPKDGARIVRLAEALRRAMEQDPGLADDLEVALQRALDEDPEFRDVVGNRRQQIPVDATANDEAVTNVFNGTAEKVIQLRDVHGGLTIN